VTTPIDSSLIPAQVRADGPKARQLYETALQFEQVLTQQLAQGLTDATQTDGSGDDSGDDTSGGGGGDGALSMYQQQLPDALAQSISGAGGLGLAQSLYDAMKAKP